jgi:hypothetical protein
MIPGFPASRGREQRRSQDRDDDVESLAGTRRSAHAGASHQASGEALYENPGASSWTTLGKGIGRARSKFTRNLALSGFQIKRWR